MFVMGRETVAAKRLPRIASACLGCPPTDCTEFTEAAVGDDLPQIAQIYTEVRLPSGGKTRKQYALKGQKHIAQGNALGKYAPH